jgi:hypothetical protein
MWLFTAAGVFHGTVTREPGTDRITDAGDLNLVPLMLVFFVIGLLMLFGAVGYGLWQSKMESSGPRRMVPHFRILARYAFDKKQNYMQDEAMIEFSEGVRYYVRATVPYGEILEYETAPATWYQCGEGMYGEAELQGKWIGRFTPYIGEPPA